MTDNTDLTSLDGDFLHLERDNHPRHFALVLELDENAPPLPVAELRERVRIRAGGFRQFQTRIDRGVWRRPIIGVAGDWDAGVNVSEAITDGPQATTETLGRLLATRLSRSTPLWHVTLITQHNPGRQLLVLRVHHALADGMTSVGYGMLLLDGTDAELAPFTRFLESEKFVLGPLDRDEKRRAVTSFASSWVQGRTRPRWPRLSDSGERQVSLVSVPTKSLYARTRELSVSSRALVLAACGVALRRCPPAGHPPPPKVRVSLPCTLDPSFRHVGNGTSITVVNLDGRAGTLDGQLANLRPQLDRVERDRPELAMTLLSGPSLLPWPMQRIVTNAFMKLLRLDVEIGVNPAAIALREVLGRRVVGVYPVPSLLGTSLAVAGLVFGDTTTFGIVADGGPLNGYASMFAEAFETTLTGRSVAVPASVPAAPESK